MLHPRSFLASWLLIGLLASGCSSKAPAPAPTPTPPPTGPTTPATTYSNPLLSSGPDPWVYQKDGFYYYMATTGNNVTMRKTAKMSELGNAPATVVWTAPSNGANSHDVWAPEMHFLDGKWYIYFTAGPGSCCGGQRLWVLENTATDPTTGSWTEKGRIFSSSEDFWAIDGTVLEQNGQRYLIWSGHANASTEEQRLYISKMANPWTLTGPRVELSRPQYSWEQQGVLPVNEGPEILQHDGKTFLVYSASHCTTDDYALGLLSTTATADPLVPTAWTKSATPVFVKNAAAGAYGPGHNTFFKSKDGQQDWLLYHANSRPGQGCSNDRNPRMQPFTYRADGTPDFGTPVSIGVALPRPSGE
ncbi:glycoside hydrolase family 43 protein [Hymenobacter sp. BT770]|uniref:glycoside hydrolase family 43 protein n=1 Tax=Hymenobacter sp. BT770 TaxID=2886942 RepID=UPI001D12FD5A|nr:glycoside hydrolase family 43 protein [Hymenobacter sp. BT770]MCC3151958.1 glycoside hydrolase family 43 protein [Hymenobacter sp. BT770]MDO3417068.1 glycoside hydrolase family 43 protein [Hymenobacter sp. BT770]